MVDCCLMCMQQNYAILFFLLRKKNMIIKAARIFLKGGEFDMNYSGMSEDALRSYVDQIRKEAEVKEQKEQEELQAKTSELLKINSQYEYKVEIVRDNADGSTNVTLMENTISRFATQGWRLINCYTNETGKNSKYVGVGGFGEESNATMDETVLVFERCVKLAGQ